MSELTVTGGVGGTRAHLEDLYRAAGGLRGAAELLDAAQSALASAYRATSSTGDPFGTCAPDARAVTMALLRSPMGPGPAAETVRALARSLEETARTYERAEQQAVDVLRLRIGTFDAAVGEVLEEGGSLVWFLGAGGVTLAGASVLLRRERAEGRAGGIDDLVDSGDAETLVHGLGSYLYALQPGRQPRDRDAMGAALVPLVDQWADSPMQVVPAFGRSRTLGAGEVPASSGAVMRLIGQTSPDGGGPAGAVAVTRLDHPDGTRAWVVAIPGTESLDLGGSNPHDNQSNVELLTGRVEANASQLVLEAMRMAGIGADEPVMLAGHSQGGMAAMVVAGAVASTYTVTHVLTAGSPVGGLSAPPGVAVLHVEHSTDMVPGLDGASSPDTPDRTTVVRDLRAAQDPTDRANAGVMTAHSVDLYARTVDLVDADTQDSSIRAWTDSTRAQIFGPTGTTGAVTVYQGIQGVSVPQLTAPGG